MPSLRLSALGVSHLSNAVDALVPFVLSVPPRAMAIASIFPNLVGPQQDFHVSSSAAANRMNIWMTSGSNCVPDLWRSISSACC